MSLQELIAKFLTITHYQEDKNILAIIFHGSRVNGHARPNSDIDVVVISKQSNNYKKGFLIDDIRVDCHIYSINDVYDIAQNKKENNNTFLEAILNNGLIIKDEEDTIAILRNYLENLNTPHNSKRKIPANVLEDIKDLYYNFKNDPSASEYYYYNLLEKIRLAFNYLYGCSYLGTSKVYEIFSNPSYYQTKYLIKLPNLDFIGLYLNAIKAPASEQSSIISELISLLHLHLDEINPSPYYTKNVYYSTDQINSDLLTFHNKLLKTTDLLLINHPYSKMMYAILLANLYTYYYQIYHQVNDELEDLYAKGRLTTDPNEMISIINEVFAILSREHQIDYDNYLIRLELVN